MAYISCGFCIHGYLSFNEANKSLLPKLCQWYGPYGIEQQYLKCSGIQISKLSILADIRDKAMIKRL